MLKFEWLRDRIVQLVKWLLVPARDPQARYEGYQWAMCEIFEKGSTKSVHVSIRQAWNIGTVNDYIRGMQRAVCDFEERHYPYGLDGPIGDPFFEALWEQTKHWDVDADSKGYCGMNGSHIAHLLLALEKAVDTPVEEMLTSDVEFTRALGQRIVKGE